MAVRRIGWRSVKRFAVALPLIVLLIVDGLPLLGRLATPMTAFALIDETTLVVLRGSAEVFRADGNRDIITATSGDAALRIGDRIRTAAESYASITYVDGSTTGLDPNTSIILRRAQKLPGVSAGISFYQELGQTWNRVESPLDAEALFETVTLSAITHARGAEYRVRVDAARETTVEAVTESVVVDAAGATAIVAEGLQSAVAPSTPPGPPSPPAPQRETLRIEVHGPARPFLRDDRYRSVGFQPDAGAYGSQIPGATYRVVEGVHVLTIPEPVSYYELLLSAEGEGGAYALTVTRLAPDGAPATPRATVTPLGSSQLSGSLSRGQHLQTGFELREGRVENLRRPGELVGSAPSNSRMLFARNQQGNAPRVQQTAVAQTTALPIAAP